MSARDEAAIDAEIVAAVREVNARNAAPDRALMVRLVGALENLSDAAQGLIQTITLTPGRTPEDEDRHGHEKWAADDLAVCVEDARAALCRAAGEMRA
jgi:hypothetical protein